MQNKFSLEVLFEKNYNLIYKVIYCITKNTHDTFDILHDTYLKAYPKFDTSRSEKEALNWLIIIAKNTAFTFMKKKNKWQSIDNYIKTLYTSDIKLNIILLYNLYSIETKVPDELFDYLLMNIIGGLSLLKISKKTNISYERLRYWRKVLTKELQIYLKDVNQKK